MCWANSPARPDTSRSPSSRSTRPGPPSASKRHRSSAPGAALASISAVHMDAPARGGLSGKVAVVTGGGSGVGRAVAKAMARQGANIVIADFDTPRMDRTVAEIVKLGTNESAIALSTDVRSDASVRSLARDAVKTMGRVDILINAAGVLLQGRLDRIS